MKNVMIINLGRQYGGAEVVTEQILKYLSSHKYDISVLCLENGKLHKSLTKKGDEYQKIKILTLPFNKKRVIEYFINGLYYVKKHKIDIIHCHGIVASFVGSIIGFLLRKKVVTTVHGNASYDRDHSIKANLFSFLEVFLSHLNKKYIAVSKDLSVHLKNKGIQSNKIEVITNGIEDYSHISRIDYRKIFNNKNVTLCIIGRLTKVKGHKYLFEAIGELKRRGIELNCIVAGEGELEQDLKRLASSLKITSNIHFIGFTDDVDGILTNVDAMVMTSLMEGLPMILLEAMKNKCLTIVPAIGGIPEVINERNGILFEPESVEDLVSKLELFYYEKYNTEMLKINAYNDFIKYWTVRVFIDKIENLYDAL